MWYDLAVAAILLFCMVRGSRKGFLWQLAAIAAVVLCFVFAETASVAIAPFLKIDPPLNRWVSMLLLYVACSFVCFAAARGLQSGLEKAKFEDYDRHLGGLFGLIKGAGIAVIVTFFAVTLSETLRPTVLSSYSGHAAAVAMHKLSPVFPEELGKVLQPYMDEFEGFEEGFGGTHLAGETDDPNDLFGDGDPFADPSSDSFDGGLGQGAGGGDWDDSGFGDFDGFGEPGPIARGDDGFGWDVEPRPSGSRVSGTPVNGGGAFGDSDASFGTTPGEGDDWFRDGEINTDRLGNELGGVARNLWNEMPEETRRNVTDSATDAVRRRVDEEFGARFNDFLGAAPVDEASGETRQDLIAEIAAIYNRDEAVQAMIRRRSAQALGPVPEETAMAVLRDWLADLRGPAAGPDPDTRTDKTTTLPERISRLSARTARPGQTAPRR